RKPIPVSSTFLWHKSVEDLHVNRLIQWLRRNVLLLLQLLGVFLLMYAVLGPRLHAAAGEGRHYVLIIDNSASMSATDVPPSRLEWAKAEALKEIDAATDADPGMVIVFNRTSEIRQSYTTNRDLLRAAVRGIEPTSTQTRLDEALALAASLSNPARSTENEVAKPEGQEPGKERTYVPPEGMEAEVHLYSDGGFPPVPDFTLANLRLNYHTPPAPQSEDGSSNNIGIVRLDAVRGTDNPAELTVTAAVRNFRATSAELAVRLEVLDADRRPERGYVRAVRLGAKSEPEAATQEVVFVLPDVPESADAALRVRLEGAADAFAFDDTAWLVPGVTRKARVLVIGPDNPLFARFFDAPSTRKIADVTRYGPEKLSDKAAYLDPARDGKFDLVVFDRCGPASEDEMPRANTLFVAHAPPPLRLVDAPVKNPRVVGWSGAHPVTRRLQGLYEIEIDEAFRLAQLPPKTDRLIESDANLVLLAGVPRPPFTDLVLAFPVVTDDGKWNTLWPLRPSFVVFLRNVVRSFGNVREPLADDVTRPGDVRVFRPGGAARVRVRTPSDRTEDIDRGNRAEVAFAGTAELGVYAASYGDEKELFAVNLFDPAESDLAPRGEVRVGSRTVTAGPTRREPRELWKLAVLGGLLVLLVEWWMYARRVRV
ncbi:MAG TPA: VWA domain-containing protein, partial [Gemmataceae bacterium]|nr:VWA domain-containing protein [Gemmataceae bacterium]